MCVQCVHVCVCCMFSEVAGKSSLSLRNAILWLLVVLVPQHTPPLPPPPLPFTTHTLHLSPLLPLSSPPPSSLNMVLTDLKNRPQSSCH